MAFAPPQMTTDQLAELLGDEDQLLQTDEATNTTIFTKRIEDGYQQTITTKEWDEKIGKRTTTMVRVIKDVVEDEEEVEEEVEEIEIDDETLKEMRSNIVVNDVVETSASGKKKKKKSKIEGETNVTEERFDKGYKEITTTKFADGTYKTSTKIFYDSVEAPPNEPVIDETSKDGKKKKKSKKTVNTNQEVIETYEDEESNIVTVVREKFEAGHKDITTTKQTNGQYKQSTQIVYYPVEKEIIETTEIIEHPPESIRMTERTRTIKQDTYSEESQETSSVKKTSKKTSKTSKVEKQQTIEDVNEQQQYQQVQQVQQNQQASSDDTVETRKIVKKSSKKVTDDQKSALMARDNNEGVTTVVREKTETGYREISTTAFPDGSSKTATREFFDAVEEKVDPEEAMAIRNNLASMVNQPPRVQVNADGSKSTIVIIRIDNGYRETTTTKKSDGSTRVATREFYDPVEEEVTESGNGTTSRRVVQSNQLQSSISNNMKSIKMFG